MTTDIIIYAACGITVLFSVAFPFINIMFRRPCQNKGKNTRKPSFSIIIPAHDNAYELEHHLPHYLSQIYDGDFEIIVVESKTGDRTDEVLAKLSTDKRLYTTFIPSTSRYMSRKKLAMTVGAKAAKNEWLIFADAECYPASNNWLDAIACELNENTDIAIGYGNYSDDASDMQRYIQLVNSLHALRKAQKGVACMAATECIAMKRNIFMDNKGFDGNLMYVRGEYDYLVNKFAETGNTSIITNRDGWTIKDAPTKKTWKNLNLFRIDTMKHLQNKHSYKMSYYIDTFTMFVAYLTSIAAICAGILVNNILLTIISALSIIICITERILIARKTIKMYEVQTPLWKVIPLELLVLIHNLKFKIKYRLSDKQDFTSHKL